MKQLFLFPLFLMAASLQAQLQITTVAGYPGKGSVNGTGGNAQYANPNGVAVDGAGNVYIADTGNNIIRVVSNGVSRTLAGTAGVTGSVDGSGSTALFNQPWGLALDASTNLYVTDFGNSTVRKITPLGSVTTLVGSAGVTGSANAIGTNTLLNHPMGIALDSSGNLYLADYGNHVIRKIAVAGSVYTGSTYAGTAGAPGYTNATGSAAAFNEPEGVAVDPSGNVYVADTGNGAIRLINNSQTVSLLAGSPGSLGNVDGSGSSALFYQPSAIAINSAGTILYVSDYFENTIRQVLTGGSVATIAGTAGVAGSANGTNGGAFFWGPEGLAVSASGTIYIADSANSQIRAMTTSGTVTTLSGSPSIGISNGVSTLARFYYPQNVAVDSGSNVYVADTQNSVIREISPAGVVSILAGTPGVLGSIDGAAGSALFSSPQGIAVDSSGHVYVADTGNSTIREISGGTVSTIAGIAGEPGNLDGSPNQFSYPQGVAVDSSGNVYIADTGNHTIRELSGGSVFTLAGLPGTFGTFDGTNTGARFNGPVGVAVDSSGNVYVSDYNNNTIRKVTQAGVVTTLAGWSAQWGSADGTGTNALFFGPSGISVDSSGNVYVTDCGNSTLRKVTTNGTVTTIAGMAGVGGSIDGTGTAAEFDYPGGVAVSPAGYVYVADTGNNTIRSQAIPPLIATQPQSQSILTNTDAIFNVTAYGSTPFGYLWHYDGGAIAGATNTSLSASNAGTYTVTVTNLAGTVTSQLAILTVTNISVMAGVFQHMAVEANGWVLFNFTGTAGGTYSLLESTNLHTWTNVATFNMTNGAIQFTDTATANVPYRFYRLVSP